MYSLFYFLVVVVVGAGGGGGTARQDYFTHFEPSQSLDAAKTGDPQNKPPGHPQAELGLSHMWPEQGLNPHRWDDERFRVLKVISGGLNHSDTWGGGVGCWILFYLYYNLRRKIVIYIIFFSKLQHNGDLTTSRTCMHLFIYLFIIFWRPFMIFLVMFMTVWSINLQIMSMWQWRNLETLRFWRRHISRATYSVSVYPYCIKIALPGNQNKISIYFFFQFLFIQTL